jgi:hypothetical protein
VTGVGTPGEGVVCVEVGGGVGDAGAGVALADAGGVGVTGAWVALAVGVGEGVEVGFGDAVALAVGVAVGDGVGLAVGVGVGETVGLAVGVAPPAANSNAPMSGALPLYPSFIPGMTVPRSMSTLPA